MADRSTRFGPREIGEMLAALVGALSGEHEESPLLEEGASVEFEDEFGKRMFGVVRRVEGDQVTIAADGGNDFTVPRSKILVVGEGEPAMPRTATRFRRGAITSIKA